MNNNSTAKSLLSEIAKRDKIEPQMASIYDYLPNPDPVLRKTGNVIDICNEIRRESKVSGCASNREAGVLCQKWRLNRETSDPDSADLISKLLNSLQLRKTMQEILEAWGYGYQVSEVIWERQGDLIMPVQLIGKPQRWFFFGKENDLRIKQSTADLKGISVEDRKFLLTQYRASYDNPYGESQYSMCFWPVTFKKGGLKFWSVFLEKFGMPHSHAKLPSSASEDDRRKALAALESMVRDACAVFPDNSTIELIQPSNISGSSDAHEKFVRYHDGQISKIILGHASAAESTPGKLGGKNAAFKVREDLIESDCRMVEDTINRLIKWVFEINRSLGIERPQFSFIAKKSNMNKRTDRDCTLLRTKKVKLSKSYFLKHYDFDDEDIEVI